MGLNKSHHKNKRKEKGNKTMNTTIKVHSDTFGVYTVALPNWKKYLLQEIADIESFKLTDKHFTEFEADGFTSVMFGTSKYIIELDKENEAVVRPAEDDEYLYKVVCNGHTELLTDDESEANECYADLVEYRCYEVNLYYCDDCVAEYEPKQWSRGS